MHVSSGAIIKNDKDELLMIDRKIEPFGWACPAGHVDPGETPEEAIVREVKEETGLDVVVYTLIHHEFVPWNMCSHGVRGHDWHIFIVHTFDGAVEIENAEVKKYEWVPRNKISTLKLERVWNHWKEKGFLQL